MKNHIHTTVREANESRKNIRRVLLTVGTPLIAVIILGVLLALITIMSTFAAERSFKTVTNTSQLNKIVNDINRSAYTSAFVEGYKAKYNYATAIAPAQPMNAINIYASEVLPISPPEFICYPVLNGLYYSTLLGDKAMEVGSFLEAEHYYNYSEYFMMTAPNCFSGASGSSDSEGESGEGESDESDQPEEGEEGESGEQSDEYKELMEDIKDKQDKAREAQGKNPGDSSGEGDRPTEEQKQQNEEQSEAGRQSQRQTQDAREAEKNGEGPTFTDKPW